MPANRIAKYFAARAPRRLQALSSEDEHRTNRGGVCKTFGVFLQNIASENMLSA